MPPTPEITNQKVDISSNKSELSSVKLSSSEVLVDNKVYSVDSLAASHPGVQLFLLYRLLLSKVFIFMF